VDGICGKVPLRLMGAEVDGFLTVLYGKITIGFIAGWISTGMRASGESCKGCSEKLRILSQGTAGLW